MRQSSLTLLMLASTMLAGGNPATANDMGQMQQMMQQMQQQGQQQGQQQQGMQQGQQQGMQQQMMQQQMQSGPNSVPYPDSQYQAPSQYYDNSQGGSPDIQTMIQGMASGRMRNKGNLNVSPKSNQNPMHNSMVPTTRY